MLTSRYVGALRLVAGLLVAGQYIVQLALDRQEGDARVVNTAGRQRMLSQRLCMWLLAVDVDGPTQVSANLAEVDRVAREWQAAHDALRRAGNSPAIEALFAQIDGDQRAMIAAARGAIATGGAGRFAADASAHQDAYLATMDAIVAAYEREARERVLGLRHTELALLAGLLAVLVLEGLFAFRPAVRGLRSYLVERDQAQQALVEVGDREQRRLAQELHDGLSQQLVGVSFLVKSLGQELGDGPHGKRADEIGALLASSLAEMRGLARRLYSHTLEVEGLIPALRELAAQTTRVSGVACHLEAPAGRIDLAMPARDHVYRIACEAVLNAAKHAKATAIAIAVERTATGVTIAVRDDGIGLAPGTTEGMGLRLMESRAKMTGAMLEIAGRPGGTTVTCTVPIRGDAA